MFCMDSGVVGAQGGEEAQPQPAVLLSDATDYAPPFELPPPASVSHYGGRRRSVWA